MSSARGLALQALVWLLLVQRAKGQCPWKCGVDAFGCNLCGGSGSCLLAMCMGAPPRHKCNSNPNTGKCFADLDACGRGICNKFGATIPACCTSPNIAQVLTIDGTPASFAVNEGKVTGNTLTLLDDQHADVDASALSDFGLGDFSIQLTVAGLGTGADPSPDGTYFTLFIKSGDKVPSPFDGPSAFVHTDTHCTTFDNWRKAHHKVDGKDPFLPAFVDGTKYGATLSSWSQCLDLCSKSGGTSSGACKQVMFASTHNNRPGRGLLFECTLLTAIAHATFPG